MVKLRVSPSLSCGAFSFNGLLHLDLQEYLLLHKSSLSFIWKKPRKDDYMTFNITGKTKP